MNSHFNQLILNKIYENLSLNDLKNCSQINKNFLKAFNNQSLWKFLLKKYYNDDIDEFREIFKTNDNKLIFKKYKNISTVKNFFSLEANIESLITLQKLSLYNRQLTTIPKEIESLVRICTKARFNLFRHVNA